MAFFDNIRFPFFTMQELNLDWILKELKRIAGFMPQDGNPGDVLTRKSDGSAWEPPEAANININALPEDTEIGDNDQLIFYDISAQANRKIKPPNLLDSMMSNGTPLMNGTGSAGTSKKPSRYDHVHPTDTSRQAALSGTQMNAVNSGAPANCFSSGILKWENTGIISAYESGQGYLKFPDGTLICYGNVTNIEGENERAWGNGFLKDFPVNIQFPVSFSSTPAVTIFHSQHFSAMAADMTFSTTGISQVQLARFTAFPIDQNYRFSWMACGRWQ